MAANPVGFILKLHKVPMVINTPPSREYCYVFMDRALCIYLIHPIIASPASSPRSLGEPGELLAAVATTHVVGCTLRAIIHGGFLFSSPAHPSQ